MSQCEHYWMYEHTIYEGDKVRRWCSKCGLIQVGSITSWSKSPPIGEKHAWGEYPDDYPKRFRKDGTK